MKKRLHIRAGLALAILSTILLTLFLPLMSAKASGDVLWDSYEMPSTRQKERLLDDADLLTSDQEKEILNSLNELSQMHQSNVVILTVDSHSGIIQDYADDYFDYNGFQADYNGSGVLFMLSMADREWAISTCGDTKYAFTSYGQEKLVEKMLPYLKDGDYYSAFKKYIEVSDFYLTQYEQGNPYDKGFKDRSFAGIAKVLAICILIGLVVALIPVLVMKSDLETVHKNVSAAGYQSHSGLHLTTHRDTYLRSTTSRTRKPENNDSGRSGGGGSFHVSSSGSSHGGSSGHF